MANAFDLEKYFDSIGSPGSLARLKAIATSNLGKRSDAAGRACENRYRRMELVEMGISYEHAVLIVNRENTEKSTQ